MRAAAILALAALGGCVAATPDDVARGAARAVVGPVLATQFPGVPLAPAANCIIDNASAAEIIALAGQAGPSGPTDAAARLVLDIAGRPATIQCLATDGLPVLLQTL